MNKIKITQLTCFDEVARVIGREQAQIELARVVHMTEYDIIYLQLNPLIAAFFWTRSPQGFSFWDDIHKKARTLN